MCEGSQMDFVFLKKIKLLIEINVLSFWQYSLRHFQHFVDEKLFSIIPVVFVCTGIIIMLVKTSVFMLQWVYSSLEIELVSFMILMKLYG